MEPNIENQTPPLKPTGTATATARATSDGGQTVAGIVTDAAHAVREHVEDRGAEMINQAKEKVSDAYDQANKRVSKQYEKAVDYGRENPGITALIAFGVGVGVGLLLVSSFSTLRSRMASES